MSVGKEDEKFSFGHFEFEMRFRNPCGNTWKAVKYLRWELRRESSPSFKVLAKNSQICFLGTLSSCNTSGIQHTLSQLQEVPRRVIAGDCPLFLGPRESFKIPNHQEARKT